MHKKDKDIHQEAVKRFEMIERKERKQRRLAIEDARFVNAEDGQWSEESRTQRANRPRYTINRIAGSIDQLIGEQRQNRTQIKVRPVSGKADIKTANIFSGLIRNIESDSNAENSYDNAYDEELSGGFGGWRITTEFNDDDSFEQDIKIKPIKSSASSLWFDTDAEEYDKRDAKYAFVTKFMKIVAFTKKYPNAAVVDFNQEVITRNNCKLWVRDDEVMIAEYWRKRPITKHIGLLSDGRVIDLDENEKVLDELELKGAEVLKTRTVKSHVVEMHLISGAEILEPAKKWAGKYIPLIPVFGKESCIEGETFIRGKVRFAKDPQRIYNYATSASIEASALAPKDPIWITDKQASGRKSELENFNKNNDTFMFYTEDPLNPGPPKRTGAPAVQTALLQQVQQASSDLDNTLNVFASQRGEASSLFSEKTVQNQISQGNIGSFIFTDNLAKSIKYTGDILIDLIPRIYDTPRMVRILKIDGTSELAAINVKDLNEINETVADLQTGTTQIVNDISQGKYDIVVDTGPAFATVRQEATQQLIELAGNSPLFAELTPDLIAKGLNLVNGEEFEKRVRGVMIKNGTVEPTEEEAEEMGLNQEQPVDPNEQALLDNVLMETEKTKSDIELNDAKTQNELVDTQSKTIDALNELLLAMQKKQTMGLPITAMDAAVVTQQTDIVLDAQDIIQGADNPNSEQLDDLVQRGEITEPQEEVIESQPEFDNQ